MGKSKLVGVVTVTFNSASVISGFMDSLLKQTQAEFILYLIDNASSDRTLDLVAQYQDPRVVIVRNSANVGVAEGNNIGIRAAMKDDCASVLLINNDTVFDSDLISKMVEGLHQFKCDMLVPKIMYFDDPEKIWWAGGSFSWIPGSYTDFGGGRKDRGQFDRSRAVAFSPTCCMLIEMDVFERIGLMDPAYFVYFDDTDFCLRAYRAGISLFYVPCGRVLHKINSLTGKDSEFQLRYGARNHVYYILKNFHWWHALIVLPVFQMYIFVKYLFYFRRPKAFWVSQKAYVEGFSLYCSTANGANKALDHGGVQ